MKEERNTEERTNTVEETPCKRVPVKRQKKAKKTGDSSPVALQNHIQLLEKESDRLHAEDIGHPQEGMKEAEAQPRRTIKKK